MIEFQPWSKTPRLFRDSIITEKIDGTNAAIGIMPQDGMNGMDFPAVYAQSRNRIITPQADNHGFARWAEENRETLCADLGPGLHFGEWWGEGIQRGYGVKGKRFSLFNTEKWSGTAFTTPGLAAVPVIDHCTFNTNYVLDALDHLRENGSLAAPGFDNPEGVCIYHTASRGVFKALIENDDIPKSMILQKAA